ncbi:hypothetical protein [Paraburkholderia sacchari]|uniref:hypothetical protein n=1 Tax=Paraburkholderia sacchari TaxID=159450 RepID=UPI000543E7E6|nr:hypothetical protein [Paraburkholderia sacchari]NLP63555.1 hypothetical protein [Paraburkholderia sacchari]
MTKATARKPTKKALDRPKSTNPGGEQSEVETPSANVNSGRTKSSKFRANDTESASPELAAQVRKAAGTAKAKRAKKDKVIRDSFTMPKADYERIAQLKRKCLEAGVAVKKSELLRAGLLLLDSASSKRLVAAISALEAVKTGRPAKSEQDRAPSSAT